METEIEASGDITSYGGDVDEVVDNVRKTFFEKHPEAELQEITVSSNSGPNFHYKIVATQ